MSFIYKNNNETKNIIKYNDIRIINGCYSELDSGWNQEESDLTITRLYYVLHSEDAYIVSDGKKTELLPGYVYVIPPGFHFERHCERLQKLFFHISIVKKNGFDMLEGANKVCCLNLGIDKVRQILQAFLEGGSVNAFIVKSSIYSCLCEAMIENHVDANEEKMFSHVVNMTIDVIRREMNYALSVKEIAKELYASDSSLSKIFKKEVGYTIRDYNSELVLKEAERRLLEEKTTVRSVSESLGFCDRFYFSKAFKNRFGVTPAEYRKKAGLREYIKHYS